MSPEQAQGKAADVRSDVFSFGAVLYELLTGRRVFERESLLDTLNAVVREEPRPPGLARVRHRHAVSREAAGAAVPDDRRREGRAPAAAIDTPRTSFRQLPSIAVLPFANMSQNADDEYFSDGLAEEIINALAQVPGLKVIARTSAFAFKGKNEDIRRIAETLGVTNVLEGSVRRAGSRIRVTAQLILGRDGTHLWSQRYDREMADIFAVQDEIAAAIAGALKLKLSPAPERRMPSLPAYEAYLRYRYYQWHFTPEDSQRSRECLEQALALDPELRAAIRRAGRLPSRARGRWRCSRLARRCRGRASWRCARSRSTRIFLRPTRCSASSPECSTSIGRRPSAGSVWPWRVSRSHRTCVSGMRRSTCSRSAAATEAMQQHGPRHRRRSAEPDVALHHVRDVVWRRGRDEEALT